MVDGWEGGAWWTGGRGVHGGRVGGGYMVDEWAGGCRVGAIISLRVAKFASNNSYDSRCVKFPEAEC